MNIDNKNTTKASAAAGKAGENTEESAANNPRKSETGTSGSSASDDRPNHEVQAGDRQSQSTGNTESRQQHQHNRESHETDSQSEEQVDEQLNDLQQEILRLNDELEKTRDAMLRKAAEFENMKRRTQKEKAQLFDQARADAVSRFLPIREDLKRSVEASKGHEVDKNFLEGLRLMLANFERILADYGVEPIEETGVPFDVEMHDAMLIQPAADESTESNTILQVMEPGYKIGDRIIKHAKVIVSQ